MPFALDTNPSPSELSDAVNYLLSNFNVTSSIDPNSGQITGPNGEILGYLYRYISIKYATSFDGTVGFSNVPTGASYFGIRNSNDATESTNPADYIWQQAAGGFGTTKFVYYLPTGNRSIQFEIATSPTSALWIVDPGTAIDLDMLATSVVQNLQCGFVPSSLLVPRSGSPLTPSFTAIAPLLYVTNLGVLVNFSAAQTDADVLFLVDTWRIGNSSSTGYADITKTNITIGNPSSATDHAVWPNPTAMASSPASLTVPIRYKTSSGYIVQINTAVQQFAFLDSGSKNGFAYLYQWNTATPGDPNGTTTFTWADNSTSAYTGTNGWFTTISSNPGTIGVQLWVASKAVVDSASATTSTVSWTTGFTKYASTGTNGSKTATVSVYQWAATIPTISGTSTYTWSDGSFTAPSGWSTTISSAPSSGFTLWKANVTLVDATSATTSSINWTGASILSAGYSGANGAASRITFARVPSNPAPVSGNITTAGNSSFPSGAQSLATWGFTATWGASDPNTSSTDSLYQSDGIYDSTTGNTVWGTPYISSLKVGSLSAITVNTGALTVSGALTVGTSGQIYSSGKTSYASTTAGFFLGYDTAAYKLKLGDGTNSLGWDGSALTIVGGSITAAAFKTSTSGARTEINTGTYGSSVAVYNASGLVSVIGTTTNVLNDMGSGYALELVATGGATGLYSHAINGYAIYATSSTAIAIEGSGGTYGIKGYGNTGVYGSGYTYGVVAESSTGTALRVLGPMTINNTTLVSNLNAEYLNGRADSYFYQASNPTGYITSAGSITGNAASASYCSGNTAGTAGNADNLGTYAASTYCRASGTDVGNAAVSGNYLNIVSTIGGVETAASGNTVTIRIVSDRRKKENIFPESLGLEFINSLLPVSYRMIGRSTTYHGFIAQDMDGKVPGPDDSLNTTHADGTRGIDYNSLIAPLVKAFQEQSAVIDELKARISALEKG